MPSTRFASGALLSSKSSFLFDLDGTLVDSSPLHEDAFRVAITALCPRLIVSFDYDQLKGIATPEAFRRLGAPHEDLVRELTLHKSSVYRASVERGELRLFPGALELLRWLRHRGAGLLLVTSASRQSAALALRTTGLDGLFGDQVITGEDVTRSKPDPEIYRRSLDELSVDASASMAIEDGIAGATSALGAGLDVALVHGGEHEGTLAFTDLHALHQALVSAAEDR